MKKLLFSFLAAGLFPVAAQCQFMYSSVPEILSPADPDSLYDINQMAAYSMSGLDFPDMPSSLYVYSWGGPGGIGWIRKEQGNPANVLDEGTLVLPYLDAVSTDIAIIFGEQTDLTGPTYQIIVAYTNYSGVFMDFYQCNVTGISLLQTIQVSNLPGNRVSVDAHKLYGFAMAWDIGDGAIHTQNGYANGGVVTLGCENVLQVNGLPLIMPDIAIGHPETTGALSLHYAAYTEDRQNVVEVTLPFDYVYNNCNPSIPVTPSVEDIMPISLAGGYFGDLPRIDCPDHYATDDWSYVAVEYASDWVTQTVYSKVRTARLAAFSVGPWVMHDDVNDGSMGNLDISSGPPYTYNANRPGIAYDPSGNYINILWHYPLVHIFSDHDYIGVRLRNVGALVDADYWIVDYNDKISPDAPALAISTQNDNSEEQFIVFAGSDPGVTHESIDYEFLPLMNWGFKPGENSTAIKNKQAGSFTVDCYPNPFTDVIRLQTDSKHTNDLLQVVLTDMSGKVIANCSGKIDAVNSALAHISAGLSKGIFFLKVHSSQAKENTVIKITKI